MNSMIQPFRRYADFRGRSRRSEFWLFMLLIVILAVIASTIDDVLGYTRQEVWDWGNGFIVTVNQRGGPASIIWFLAVIVPSLAVAVRRLHDTDKSGWWLLLSLIPVAGSLVLLIFYMVDGTRGPNSFGPDPKGHEPLSDRRWSDDRERY